MCRNIFAVQHTLTASITGMILSTCMHNKDSTNVFICELEKRRSASFLDFDNFWLNLKATREQLQLLGMFCLEGFA